MCKINLSQLIGGGAFTLSCTVSNNGLGIKTSTLIDTGANGFVFIDTEFAKTVCKFLDVTRKRLPTPCRVQGFDGQVANSITEYLEANLIIDGRKQLKMPMLVVKLGGQDMILGRKWAADFDILIDCKNRKLIWPEDQPKAKDWSRVIITHKKNLAPELPNQACQEDADRRDRLLEKDTWRPQAILKRIHSTWESDQRKSYVAMDTELKGRSITASVKVAKVKKQDIAWKPTIDICGISAEAFYLNMKRSNNVVFTTSLYEIDRILEERQSQEADLAEGDQQPDETELQWLQRVLPNDYKDFADVFSKEASNVLPPHRSYDHKIQIDDPKALESLGYSPLYHQSTDELKEIKRFLEENLERDFVVPSQAPFASPTLFVKKPNGGLRFCIDFRKLNNLTRKDRYPIPLIEETLARIAKAKVYTKLDIRQAFHRIRMHPDSEELTTFRTRYRVYKCKVL